VGGLSLAFDMDPLNDQQLHEFLARVNVHAADPERGIGRELSYRPTSPRLVVIHFGDSDSLEYMTRILSIVLSTRESWLLIPRRGPASGLGLSDAALEAEALVFGLPERGRLCAYLCERDKSLSSVSADLYALSADGDVMVTWDHHTADEGLQIDLRDVNTTSRLLADLNSAGVELELFYTDG
jgi:hypothetical protein